MSTFGQHVFNDFVLQVRGAPRLIIIGIAVSDMEYLPHRVRDVAAIPKVLRHRHRIRIDFAKLGSE